jgi:hypothetical protein
MQLRTGSRTTPGPPVSLGSRPSCAALLCRLSRPLLTLTSKRSCALPDFCKRPYGLAAPHTRNTAPSATATTTHSATKTPGDAKDCGAGRKARRKRITGDQARQLWASCPTLLPGCLPQAARLPPPCPVAHGFSQMATATHLTQCSHGSHCSGPTQTRPPPSPTAPSCTSPTRGSLALADLLGPSILKV